jgi:hypothetical protein
MKTWFRWILLILSIGGGFTGFVLTIKELFHPQSKQIIYFILFCGFSSLYLFILIAGLIFADNPKKIKPLLLAFALQVPWVSSPIMAYRFSAGIHLTVGVIGGDLRVLFRLGSDWQFNLMQNLSWGIGVNVPALVLIFLLLNYRKLKLQSLASSTS